MSAFTQGYLLKIGFETTAQQIVQQMQTTYAKLQQLSVEDQWKKFAAMDFTPLSSQQLACPVSLLISNMGRCDLKHGPIEQAFGYTTIECTGEKLQFLLNSGGTQSGKYGVFMCDQKLTELSEER